MNKTVMIYLRQLVAEYFQKKDPSLNPMTLNRLADESTARQIVDLLEDCEKRGSDIWGDEEFGLFFYSQSTKFYLPDNLILRQMWIAVICQYCAVMLDFDSSNLIIPPDYLPEESEIFENYRKRYGDRLLDEIVMRRKKLHEAGK